MTSYRHPADDDRRLDLAGESGGAYEHNPLARMASVLDEFEDIKRRVLDTYRDVVAWGGTAQTTGYTQSEWLALVGRLPGRDAWKFDLLVRRLPAMPVTATLLETGQLTLDQAVSIVAGTKRLSGDVLATADEEAAQVALSRNRRGDDPDMDADVDAIVQALKPAAAQDRLDRDRLEQNRVRIQPDLWGTGRIVEDWADPEGFQTRVAGLDHAAGRPSPDIPRSQQLAEGSLAMARAWLAGHRPTDSDHGTAADTGEDRHDSDDVDTAVADRIDQPDLADLAASAARPTMVVRVDLTDLDGRSGAVGRLASASRLASTPWLGRQVTDTLACNADVVLAVVDGVRPLAEFRPRKRLPGRIRRQVLWRDLGCRWPGCRAPLAHCDVHHLNEVPSDHRVDNLVTLCRRHHRRLHSTFWHARLDAETGRFELRRTPHGRAVHTTWPRGDRPRATPPTEVAPTR